MDEDGNWSVDEFVPGDTLTEVLEYAQYEPKHLQEAIRKETEVAVQKGRLSLQEGTQLFNFYRDGLNGYTYLEKYEDEPTAGGTAPAAGGTAGGPAGHSGVPPTFPTPAGSNASPGGSVPAISNGQGAAPNGAPNGSVPGGGSR
jgi:hypothetical protein